MCTSANKGRSVTQIILALYLDGLVYVCNLLMDIVCVCSTFPLSVIDKITVTKYYNISLSAPSLTEQNNGVITSRAKKRWYLAYTLVRNPKLIELRKRDNQDKDGNEDSAKNIGYHMHNPVYGNYGGEFGIPIEKDDASKL